MSRTELDILDSVAESWVNGAERQCRIHVVIFEAIFEDNMEEFSGEVDYGAHCDGCRSAGLAMCVTGTLLVVHQ